MTEVPTGSEFTKRWRALTTDERKELTQLANAGETSDDATKAAMIAGLAQKRSRPLELVALLVATVVGYVVVAQAFLAGPEPAIVFGLAVGVAAFLIFQRKRLLLAHSKSLDVLRGDA